MSRKITRAPKTRAEEEQEELRYQAYDKQWEEDQESRRAGTKPKPTEAEVEEKIEADRARHLRQMYPAPAFGGVDRHFAGQSERHKMMLMMQASNRGKKEEDSLDTAQEKIKRELDKASTFIVESNETLARQGTRWHVLVGFGDRHLDELLEQIYHSKTWNDIDAPKPDLSREYEPTHNRLALKTYIMQNRRMSDTVRALMDGEDVIRTNIQKLSDCRDNGVVFLHDIAQNPQEHGRDNADGREVPQIAILADIKSFLTMKQTAWRLFLDEWTKTAHPSIQVTFDEMLTFRQEHAEKRRRIKANIEAGRRGPLSRRRDTGPAARGPPASKRETGPAARGPPRESDPDTDALAEGMRKLNPNRSMHMLLMQLKADADIDAAIKVYS